MSAPRVNHGPCIVCGRAVVYLGARHCGPSCHFSSLGAPESLASLRPAVDDRPRPEPLVKEPVFFGEEPIPASDELLFEAEEPPDPAPLFGLEAPPDPAPLFGLEAPPDEPPVRRRLYL